MKSAEFEEWKRTDPELGGWAEKKSGREKDEEGGTSNARWSNPPVPPPPQVPRRTVDPGKEIRNGTPCAQCHSDGNVLSGDTPVLQKICLRGDPDKQF